MCLVAFDTPECAAVALPRKTTESLRSARYVRGETFYTPILNGLQKIEGLEAFDITVESSI